MTIRLSGGSSPSPECVLPRAMSLRYRWSHLRGILSLAMLVAPAPLGGCARGSTAPTPASSEPAKSVPRATEGPGGTPPSRTLGAAEPAAPEAGFAVGSGSSVTAEDIRKSWPKLVDPLEREAPPDPLLVELALAFQPRLDLQLAAGPSGLARILGPQLSKLSADDDVAFVFEDPTLADGLARIRPNLGTGAHYAAVLTGYSRTQWRTTRASELATDAYSVLFAALQAPRDLEDGGPIAALYGLLEAQGLAWRSLRPPRLVLIADQQKWIRPELPPLEPGALSRLRTWATATSAHLTLIAARFDRKDGRVDAGTTTLAEAFRGEGMPYGTVAGYFRFGHAMEARIGPVLENALSTALLSQAGPGEDVLVVVDREGGMVEGISFAHQFARAHQQELDKPGRRFQLVALDNNNAWEVVPFSSAASLERGLAQVRPGNRFAGMRDLRKIDALISQTQWRAAAAKRVVFLMGSQPTAIPSKLIPWAEAQKAHVYFLGVQ
jgi:hypothetical protein